MKRKVKDFSRSEAKKIAINYATTSDDLTASYFAMLYNTTSEDIYGILRRAVVESMVSDRVVSLIANKSGRNSAEKAKVVGQTKSYEKYQRLMERRAKFQFPREKREYYAIEYANSDPAITLRVFAELHCMSRSLLQRTLVSAVVDNVVSDEVVEKLHPCPRRRARFIRQKIPPQNRCEIHDTRACKDALGYKVGAIPAEHLVIREQRISRLRPFFSVLSCSFSVVFFYNYHTLLHSFF